MTASPFGEQALGSETAVLAELAKKQDFFRADHISLLDAQQEAAASEEAWRSALKELVDGAVEVRVTGYSRKVANAKNGDYATPFVVAFENTSAVLLRFSIEKKPDGDTATHVHFAVEHPDIPQDKCVVGVLTNDDLDYLEGDEALIISGIPAHTSEKPALA